VGIDVNKTEAQVAVINEMGKPVEEVRAKNTNLSIDLTIFVEDGDLRFIFMHVDDDVFHSYLLSGTTLREPHLYGFAVYPVPLDEN
jgi:hypothetical protein